MTIVERFLASRSQQKRGDESTFFCAQTVVKQNVPFQPGRSVKKKGPAFGPQNAKDPKGIRFVGPVQQCCPYPYCLLLSCIVTTDYIVLP